MVATTNSISGSYVVSDTAGIKAFCDATMTGLSGASVFVIPAGGNTCYVGVTQNK